MKHYIRENIFPDVFKLVRIASSIQKNLKDPIRIYRLNSVISLFGKIQNIVYLAYQHGRLCAVVTMFV